MERDEEFDRRSADAGRWLDGEMSEPERAAFQRRLESDPELAHEVELLRAVRETVRRRPRLAAPPGFAARVIRAVRPGEGESPWLVLEPFVRGLAAAASILLLVSLGMWLFLERGPRDSFTAGPIRPSAMERALLGDASSGGFESLFEASRESR